MTKYHGEFKNRDTIIELVEYGENVPPEDEIVYASYNIDGYEGSALIVWTHEGKLFSNYDSHCSCMGLENWSPEETSVEALKMHQPE